MHVCMYACMYVCMFVRMQLCMYHACSMHMYHANEMLCMRIVTMRTPCIHCVSRAEITKLVYKSRTDI